MLIIFLRTAIPAFERLERLVTALLAGLIVGVVFMLVCTGVIVVIQLGLCHLIAKWFFGATGTFVGVLRPLLLAWFVKLLIPFLGMLAAAIAWTAVPMMVFEEVDGIGRLQAFGISAGINVCFLALQYALQEPR